MAPSHPEILRYAAFTSDPAGGNPAGVVLDAAGLGDDEMLAIAADLGYSETAFLTGDEGDAKRVRYFSPLAEVPFCGHATIATAVAWAQREGLGLLRMTTNAGAVPVEVSADGDELRASMTTVAPRVVALPDEDLAEILGALGWAATDLDPQLPPRVAYAGAWHPVLAAATRERLARLDYDFERLGALMANRDWTTVQLVHRAAPDLFFSRNPFPPGGVVEDPATGAAAAAFGGYLAELGLVEPPATVTIHQGDDLGRPGVIEVAIPADRGAGITVTGTAVVMA